MKVAREFIRWIWEGVVILWGWGCILSRLSRGKSAEEEHGIVNVKEDTK